MTPILTIFPSEVGPPSCEPVQDVSTRLLSSNKEILDLDISEALESIVGIIIQ